MTWGNLGTEYLRNTTKEMNTLWLKTSLDDQI